MPSSILRQIDGDYDDSIRVSYDYTDNVDWYRFTCRVAGKTILAYARTAICPIRCRSFDVVLVPRRRG